MTAMEGLKTINSFVRTVLACAVLGAGGFAAWIGYSTYYEAEFEDNARIEALNETKKELEETRKSVAEKEAALQAASADLEVARADVQAKAAEIRQKDLTIVKKDEEIGELETDVAKKKVEIERLSTAVRFLKVDRRLAKLKVLDKTVNPETGRSEMLLEFVEVNDSGEPIDKAKQFKLEGDKVYIAYWVVKFKDVFVEEGSPDRSTSICQFERIFGEYLEPSKGYLIDKPGSRPNAYGRGAVSEFEQDIWSKFWDLAKDKEKASELGIRAMHGEAVYTRVDKGKTYQVTLRASGGLTITSEDNVPPRDGRGPLDLRY